MAVKRLYRIAKEKVAGSNPVFRSHLTGERPSFFALEILVDRRSLAWRMIARDLYLTVFSSG